MIYFHSYKSPGLVVDLVKDIRRLNDLSVKAKKAGMIILGGGVCKHQIANAMLFVRMSPFFYSGPTLTVNLGVLLLSETGQTTPSTSIQAKSLMGPTAAQDPTRP